MCLFIEERNYRIGGGGDSGAAGWWERLDRRKSYIRVTIDLSRRVVFNVSVSKELEEDTEIFMTPTNPKSFFYNRPRTQTQFRTASAILRFPLKTFLLSELDFN